MRSERLHRLLRAILSRYPIRPGAAWLNRRLDRLCAAAEAQWLLAPGRGDWPTMVLDVTHHLQRKFFYFPRVYGRFYGDTSFRRYLERRLRPGATFVDIGANVGFFSLLAARIVGPTGRVYAFEPDPRLHAALTRSAQASAYGHVTAYPLALSDREGELPFFRARDGTASSLVDEVPARRARYEGAITTPVTTLDGLVERGMLDLRGVELIKVDVEGEEARTVAGMLRSLATASPSIWCEVRGPQGSTRAPGTFAQVAERFATIGYRPFRHDGAALRPLAIGDVRDRCDVLFERA